MANPQKTLTNPMDDGIPPPRCFTPAEFADFRAKAVAAKALVDAEFQKMLDDTDPSTTDFCPHGLSLELSMLMVWVDAARVLVSPHLARPKS